MKFWQPLRTSLLILTFGTVLLVFGKSVVSPASKELTETPFVFPSEVPLPGWQPVKSQVVEDTIPRNLYEYTSANLLLEIEMQYVDHPHVNEKLFRQYDPRLSSPEKLESVLKQQDQTGFYSLEIAENRAYLRSCINPNSPSAIIYEQFIQNRYTYDLKVSRLLPILLGQEPLRDHRCLWTHLSVPLDDLSTEQAYLILEKAWLSWYQWWQPQFPKI
jgi:cyanosortase A-associated protein